jgi:uncharacterized lipoprotein YajG
MRRRRARLPILLLLPLIATAAGCASRTSGLDVRYPVGPVNRAVLATVESRTVKITPADSRIDPTRIGTSPATGKPIVTARPVTEVVQEALAIELARNGHTVVAEAPNVVVSPRIEEFWLDVVVGRSSTHYVGKVAIALAVTDGHTGDTLLERRYIGIRRRSVEDSSASETEERDVMDAALERAMHELATDAELAGALAGRRTTQRQVTRPTT